MRHLLMDPDFPDLIAIWSTEESKLETPDGANEKRKECADALPDRLLTALARLEIAATRLW
jgi:hypothetical protein